MESKMSEVLQFTQMSMPSVLDLAEQACKERWVSIRRVLELEAEAGLFIRNGHCLVVAPFAKLMSELPALWVMQIV